MSVCQVGSAWGCLHREEAMFVQNPNTNRYRCLSFLLAGMMAVTSLPLPVFAADAAAGEEIAISAERFPDEQFRNYISEQLDSDGDNMLSATECSEVVDLNVSQQGIADLTGIDVFSKLQQLDCSGNTLSALDISGAAQLLQLNCSANPDLSALKLPEKMVRFPFW